MEDKKKIESVDVDHLKVAGRPPSEGTGVKMEDDVLIIVTQLFCPNGHNLVDQEDKRFDGYGGIRLLVGDGQKEGVVVLSPFHGDRRKEGITFPEGTKLSLRCPVCGVELPSLASCTCEGHGELRKLYLTPELEDSHLVAVCDVWGCPRSRVIDENEILSEYVEGNITDLEE